MNRNTRRKIAAITGIAASSLILPAAPALAMPARPALILPPSISAKAEAAGHLFSRGDYELAMLMFAKFAPSMGGAGDAGGLRPQDVFAATLYSGTSGVRSLTTGIDLLGFGGLAWSKARNTAGYGHDLCDTVRGGTQLLVSNTTAAQSNSSDTSGFTTTGLSLRYSSGYGNESGTNYVNWSFRRAAKFFDIVTYTGNGSGGRTIAHGLGVAPGMVVIKRLNSTSDWFVAHPAADKTGLALNLTSAAATGGGISAQFTTSTINLDYIQSPSFATPNVSGATYVAYFWAHDPSPSGIVQCGSYAGNNSATGPVITLGWRPQYLLVRRSDSTSSWVILDSARSTTNPREIVLYANYNFADSPDSGSRINFNSTGFQPASVSPDTNSNGGTHIYLAIREPI